MACAGRPAGDHPRLRRGCDHRGHGRSRRSAALPNIRGCVADSAPAYLIAGDDEAKIDAALARLRARAEREAGAGALESFSPPDGLGPPDLGGLAAAIPAMSLTAPHRYLLADHVERAGVKQLEELAGAIGGLGGD